MSTTSTDGCTDFGTATVCVAAPLPATGGDTASATTVGGGLLVLGVLLAAVRRGRH